VHLFRSPTQELVVYVTKSPGVPVLEAHAAMRAAVEAAEGRAPEQRPHVVYDGYSIGRSGSI